MNRPVLIVVLCLMVVSAPVASRQGMTFETKGVAEILRKSTFTFGTEARNIPIPQFINAQDDPAYFALRHDRDSGWTMCRVPLKSERSITGTVERTLVFECKPLAYYP